MSEKQNKLRVGITLGDVAGIGPEIIIKTFMNEQMFKICTPIIFGNSKAISYYVKALDIQKLKYGSIKSFDNLPHNTLNIYNVTHEEINITPGSPDKETGQFALNALEDACEALKNKDIDVLVTGPVNKKAINLIQSDFKGQTEYIQEKLGQNSSMMMMISDDIRLGLVTNHLSIKDVPAALNSKLLKEKIISLENTLKQDFGIDRPKIAVLGLNPHAGDQGILGSEEEKIIIPVIGELKRMERLVFGPFSADAFWGQMAFKAFDGIIAMYHDQGLIPFKYIAGMEGTNFTAGMDYVRTSPDHGTAEDIAGKNEADTTSLRNAIYRAIDIFNQRLNYHESRANALDSQNNN